MRAGGLCMRIKARASVLFPRARFTHQAQALTGLKVEADPVHRLHRAFERVRSTRAGL